MTLIRAAKQTVRTLLPLEARKRLVVWLGRQPWVPDRYYWTLEMLRDFAERDPNAFHRFLWSHHLAYAESYDVAQRLQTDQLHPSRHLFIEELVACLEQLHVRGDAIDSVLDVGSSLGYVLRHLERHVFTSATLLYGVDIDEFAIAEGAAYLKHSGSRVRLRVADMSRLDDVIGPTTYDVVYCAGTLMYLQESDARDVVHSLVRRTRRVIALTGLAHPERDNAQLEQSAVRERDGTFIHNLDAMLRATGARIVRRRYDGARQLDGNTIYFVFAVPEATS